MSSLGNCLSGLDPAASRPRTRLLEAGLRCVCECGDEQWLSRDVCARSSVLIEVLAEGGSGGSFTLPFPARALRQWIRDDLFDEADAWQLLKVRARLVASGRP